MKGLNNIYFKKPVDFFFEFLPQIVMLLSLFGFMDFLIFVKWNTDYNAMTGAKPPSIISTMINMFLNFGELPPGSTETPFFNNQVFWLRLLLFVSLICVPTMLFVKPIYEFNSTKKHKHIEDEKKEREEKGYTAINDDIPENRKTETAL